MLSHFFRFSSVGGNPALGGGGEGERVEWEDFQYVLVSQLECHPPFLANYNTLEMYKISSLDMSQVQTNMTQKNPE